MRMVIRSILVVIALVLAPRALDLAGLAPKAIAGAGASPLWRAASASAAGLSAAAASAARRDRLSPDATALGDLVWEDLNANGLQDLGEPGMPGATVNLYADGGALLQTTTTDADGLYLFDNLAAGDYQIEFIRPAGALFSPQDIDDGQSLADARDSDADQETGLTATITLAAGEVQPAWDAGLYWSAGLGDFVWYDANDDGRQSLGEPGIANVTVYLYEDSDGSGDLTVDDTQISARITGATGAYYFGGLTPGDYIVTIADDPPDPALDGLSPTFGPQSAHPVPLPAVGLDSGEAYRSVDLGYVRPVAANAILGDFVWYDGDGDGLPDPAEPGVAGVNVCATLQGGGATPCATTDAAGRYAILATPGVYTVALAPGQPELIGLRLTTPPSRLVTTTAGQQALVADFGYAADAVQLGAIGDLVWDDTPATGGPDGVFNPANEKGVAGVTVDLISDLDGDGARNPGEPVIATATTDAAGFYQFTGLIDGAYLVEVSDTGAALVGYEMTALGPGVGQNNNNQAQPYAVTVAGGQANQTADFGYFRSGVLTGRNGAIGDAVWYDLNGDGVRQHGEPGVAGVTVDLVLAAAEIATQTTQADGAFLFAGLAPGAYTVEVSDEVGVLGGTIVSRPGPNQGQNGNNQVQPYAITLGADQVNRTADFAYVHPASLGGFTWIDTNTDGQYDPSHELPLNGAIIQVVDDRDGRVVATLTSGSAGGFAPGRYAQTNLVPGAYTVRAAAWPSGFAPSGATSLPATLAPGGQAMALDFPFSSTTAVAVASFTAQQRGDQVVLKWTTVSERGNTGFHVQRAAQASGPYAQLSTEPVPSQAVSGAGASYRWVDATAQPGMAYWYRLVTAPDGVVIGPAAMERASTRIYLPLLLH
jgi:hypothetical protein